MGGNREHLVLVGLISKNFQSIRVELEMGANACQGRNRPPQAENGTKFNKRAAYRVLHITGNSPIMF